MGALDKISHRLKTNVGRFLLAIQTVRKIDASTFQKIDDDGKEVARLLKGHPLIPKSLLSELHTAAKILRAEAPDIKTESQRMIDMANKLEMTFDLILLGESDDDRTSGVPRII